MCSALSLTLGSVSVFLLAAEALAASSVFFLASSVFLTSVFLLALAGFLVSSTF
jgi:hypothetical protein